MLALGLVWIGSCSSERSGSVWQGATCSTCPVLALGHVQRVWPVQPSVPCPSCVVLGLAVYARPAQDALQVAYGLGLRTGWMWHPSGLALHPGFRATTAHSACPGLTHVTFSARSSLHAACSVSPEVGPVCVVHAVHSVDPQT